MLFQNSCVVPLGITAIVSLFFPPLAEEPGREQLSVPSKVTTIRNRKLFFIWAFPLKVCRSNFSYAFRSRGHRTSQCSELFDLDLHDITRLKKNRRLASKSDTRRSPCGNNITRLERDCFREKLDQPGNAEYELVGVGILHRLPVELQFDKELMWISRFIGGHN